MSDINFYPLTISDAQAETDNAVCITFAVPEQQQKVFNFKQGQFLTLKAVINGQEIIL